MKVQSFQLSYKGLQRDFKFSSLSILDFFFLLSIKCYGLEYDYWNTVNQVILKTGNGL